LNWEILFKFQSPVLKDEGESGKSLNKIFELRNQYIANWSHDRSCKKRK